jgi:hypothetical protein
MPILGSKSPDYRGGAGHERDPCQVLPFHRMLVSLPLLACDLRHGAGILGNRMLSHRLTGHDGPLQTRLCQIGAHDLDRTMSSISRSGSFMIYSEGVGFATCKRSRRLFLRLPFGPGIGPGGASTTT